MSLFDLIFIAGFLGAVGTALTALVQLVRGRRDSAERIAVGLVVGIALYVAVVIGVSLTTPQRVLPQGERRCWDEWCLAVESAVRADSLAPGAVAAHDESLVMLAVRISSRSRGRAQREGGVRLFLLDSLGVRYEVDTLAQRALTLAGIAGDSIGSVLQPGASILHHVAFRVPRSATGLGLGKDGMGPGPWIIADETSLFHKRTVNRLDLAGLAR
jgi:hypothetical protein